MTQDGGSRQEPQRPARGKPGAGTRRFAARAQGVFDRLLGSGALWAALFVAILVPIVSQQGCGLPAPAYRVGEVAPATIKAPYDIELLDERATRDRREAERESVLPVYDLVVELPAAQRARLVEFFEAGRAALRGKRRGGPLDAETIAGLRGVLRQPVAEDALLLLAGAGFSTELEEAALRIHASIMQGRIVESRKGLPDDGPIVVREVHAGSPVESLFGRMDQIRDIGDARSVLRERIDREPGRFTAGERHALETILDGMIVANLSYNASETERRRAMAVASVPQVFMRIPRGRVIVREGEVFGQDHLDLVARIQRGSRLDIDWLALAGNALLLTLLALFLRRYVEAHQKIFRRVKNLYALVLLVLLITASATAVGVFLADSVADRFTTPPFNDPTSLRWALPVPAGAMLITLLANGRVATVAAAVTAVLFGMILGWDARAMVFALLSSFAAIYGVSRYERRTAILKAGALTGCVNAAVVFALECAGSGFSPPTHALFRMGMALAGGILAIPIVTFTLPILEWLFHVLTDIRLLELSNLDNPLLRRLSMEAPGTYNHSIIVGTLAEQAAEEIGAHALLCRVSAYYHDIGKMARPDYYVENMHQGVNRHDRLSPRMSSLVIANHVKEGLRLAEEYNLPRQIRDIIPQHHGTRLITFFYRKAKRNEDPDTPELHEHDYRYPGPKPQTREAAIFMMADSVEAAARTVDDPTPGKFEEVINTIVNAIILDRQLDECDLTFNDLDRIRGSFLRTLTAVHHHRIAYPGFQFDRSKPRAVESE